MKNFDHEGTKKRSLIKLQQNWLFTTLVKETASILITPHRLTWMEFPGLPGSELGGVNGGTYINRLIGAHKLLWDADEYLLFPYRDACWFTVAWWWWWWLFCCQL